jgi:glutaredoxin 3
VKTVLTLYQTEWCVYSHRVRRLLTELCLVYACVNVPATGEDRTDLRAVSGQTEIPVLLDGEQVVIGSEAILEHLHQHYPATPSTAKHHRTGEFRYAKECGDPPNAVLEHLRSLLVEHRLKCVSETLLPMNGDDGDDGDYILVQACSTAIWKTIVRSDPATVGAVAVRIGIWPTATGSGVCIEDPVAGAWLAGTAETIWAARQARPRIKQIVDAL